MTYLLSFPLFRKLTSALVAVLRVAQTPFVSVAYWLEAAASRLETTLENSTGGLD